MKSSFSKEQSCTEGCEWVIPKPPAPPKPSSSALANAAAAVAAPPPDKTPIQTLNEAANKIDIKAAGMHFNGACLEKNDIKEIKTVSCNAKFRDLLQYFS